MAAGACKVSTHVRRDTDSEGHDKICHSQFDPTNWKWVSHLNDTDNHTHTYSRLILTLPFIAIEQKLPDLIWQ